MSRNIFEENQINIRELNNIVSFCARHKKSLLIYGGPGLGKSEKIQQLADQLFGKRTGDMAPNVVDFRLADKEPSDVVGHQIPTEVDGVLRTVYALPDFWPNDPDWEGFIFMDELLNAEPYLQNVAFQIMLDRRIGKYQFPKGAVMVAAGNRDGDGGATHALIPALANRMMLVELYYDTKVFLEDYAIPNNIHSTIVGMLKKESHLIENYERQCVDGGSPSFTTPRTLVDASKVLYELDAGLITEREKAVMLQGLVGKMTADAISLYHRNRTLPDIEGIMNGTVTKSSSLSDDMQYVMGMEGTRFLRREVMDDTIPDSQIIEHAKNFLTYLQDNFAATNADFVMSIFLTFLNKSSAGEALLKANSRREKLIPQLANQYSVVMDIVNEYMDQYAEAVKAAKANKTT